MTALAQCRQERGWKKARLILELKRAAGNRGMRVASDESLDRMVREWESGRRPLVGEYLTLFCDVYESTAVALGAFPDDAKGPDEDEVAEFKRELLAARSADISLVKLLESQTENLRQLDRRLGASALLPQIQGHVAQMEGLLRNGVVAGARQLTAAALSDAAALAGWQALDLGRYRDAWNLHEIAKNAAREAGSSVLLTHATAQQACILLDLNQPVEALQLVQQAQELGKNRLPALMATWISASEAEVQAVLGNDKECRRALQRADESLPSDATNPEMPFLFLAGPHLVRWRGACLAQLGALEAVEDLSRALGSMEPGFTRAEAGTTLRPGERAREARRS
ncbi:hypothetical protein GCM10020221_22710 [Streptomyces thioluteus]|uniref:Uncharacterized protein n=1 Tax=Streptomyces thioluteus TaxID=66431 RepID=A0ABP6J9K5_STRTU